MTKVLKQWAVALACLAALACGDEGDPGPNTGMMADPSVGDGDDMSGGQEGEPGGNAGDGRAGDDDPAGPAAGEEPSAGNGAGEMNPGQQDPAQPMDDDDMDGDDDQAADDMNDDPIDRGMPPMGDPDAVNPYPGYSSDVYSQDEMWMCKPGLANNYCLDDMNATRVLADGTFEEFVDRLSTSHPVDCIYYYPTVPRHEDEDVNSLDFSHPEPMVSTTRAQAARLSRVCNVFAPFYRQTPLNLNGRPYDRSLGTQDVQDSFKHYIANWNQGRPYLVMGHSQGSGHAQRLISAEIDGTELQERMLSALILGGGVTESAFDNIPPCRAPDQIGCVIGFNSVAAGTGGAGSRLCNHPGALSGGEAIFKGAYFPSAGARYTPELASADITQPWALFPGLFKGECDNGYLQVSYVDDASDTREQFIDLASFTAGFGAGNLHVLDLAFPMDDLIDLVAAQAEAMAAKNP